jgi:hypothetical protein
MTQRVASIPSDRWRARAALLTALLTALLSMCVAARAQAHHDQATTRVADASGAQSWGWGRSGQVSARLIATLSYRFSLFNRALIGASPYTKSPLGSVTLHWSTPSLQATFSTATVIGLRVPVGALVLSPASGEEQVLMGLGDMQLFAAQDALAWLRLGLPVSVWLRAGLSAPTGHHSEANALRVTDVSAAPSGAFGLTTYSARANLGSGAWSASGAALAAWSAAGWLDLQLGGEVAAPLTLTADGVRWGVDMEVSAGARAEVIADRLWVTGGAGYRWHTQDDVPTEDEVTGARGRAATGGRREVGVRVGLGVAVAPPLLCTVEVSAPAWQEVEGVQLVERVSVTTGCAFSLPL